MVYVLPKWEDCESLTDNPFVPSLFIEPWPPPILKVNDVIGHANTKNLDLRITPKKCAMTLITILNKFGSHVVCVIFFDLKPDISWGRCIFLRMSLYS